MKEPYFTSEQNDFTLYHGNTFEILPELDCKFDCIFADPPYFLSNGGITVQSGKQVSVNKGSWDTSKGLENDYQFNYNWLSLCREKLTEKGTIWVSGTYHNIFMIAQAMNELGYKILNVITWAKTNPPPNLSCRYFTHSTEFIIWARKTKKIGHLYNYQLIKAMNGNKQMKDVWNLPAIAKWEKKYGKHPTQKPLPVLSRIILASTQENDLILDPFSGASTTGISANLFGRRFVGIEQEEEFVKLSICRRLDLELPDMKEFYTGKVLKTICKIEEEPKEKKRAKKTPAK